MKFFEKLLVSLPLPSPRDFHNWCIAVIVLAFALDTLLPGHDEAYGTLIVGTVVVYFVDWIVRGKSQKRR